MRKIKYFLGVLMVSLAFVLVPGRAAAIQEYGDVNFSTNTDISDVVCLIDRLLSGETTIVDDINGDLEVNIVDVTVLIDYLLSGKWEFDLYYPPVPDSAMVVTVNGVSFAMMPVKGGIYKPFQYSGGGIDPDIEVTLSDFYLSMTEVTAELWEAVMGSRPVSGMMYKAKPNQPMDMISYRDCKEFIARLNELTGLAFHMPTYDQWNYAALGGQWTHGYNYAGSDDIDEVAWYDGNRPELFERYRQKWGGTYSMPVGMKKPNELGLYDMSGNMMERLENSSNGDGENYWEPDPDDTGFTWVIGGDVFNIADWCYIHHAHKYTIYTQYDVALGSVRLCLQASSLKR